MNKQQLILAGVLMLLSCGKSPEERFLDEIHREFDSLNKDMTQLKLTIQHTTNDSIRFNILVHEKYDYDEMENIIQTEVRIIEH